MPVELIGTRIGHIKIGQPIGSGGMGEVYRGFDEVLERPVAIKAIRADRRMSSEAKMRFLREARLLSKLDHPASVGCTTSSKGRTATFSCSN